MSTLMKRRNRTRLTPQLSKISDRLLSPWTNDPLSIWNRGFSTSPLDELFNIDDVFNADYFDQDSLMPAMNVKENEDDFEVEVAAPGFSKRDFEVTIDGKQLNISGKKSEKIHDEDDNYTNQEFNYRSFKRSSTLPDSVDLDQNVKAVYKNGILQINLAKKEEAKKLSSKKVIHIE